MSVNRWKNSNGKDWLSWDVVVARTDTNFMLSPPILAEYYHFDDINWVSLFPSLHFLRLRHIINSAHARDTCLGAIFSSHHFSSLLLYTFTLVLGFFLSTRGA